MCEIWNTNNDSSINYAFQIKTKFHCYQSVVFEIVITIDNIDCIVASITKTIYL